MDADKALRPQGLAAKVAEIKNSRDRMEYETEEDFAILLEVFYGTVNPPHSPILEQYMNLVQLDLEYQALQDTHVYERQVDVMARIIKAPAVISARTLAIAEQLLPGCDSAGSSSAPIVSERAQRRKDAFELSAAADIKHHIDENREILETQSNLIHLIGGKSVVCCPTTPHARHSAAQSQSRQ